MKNKYSLFDFQGIVQQIRHKHELKNEPKSCQELLESVDEKMTIEDMPFYKDYLSTFDTEHAFDSLVLKRDTTMGLSEADCDIMQKLVYASYSSNYNFFYDNDSLSYELWISVTSEDKTTTKKFHDLDFIQVMTLFLIYVEEQFNLEGIKNESEIDKDIIDKERSMRKIVFEKKIMQLKRQIDNQLNLMDLLHLLDS